MAAAFGLGGWILAAASLVFAAVLQTRLSRRMHAVGRACHELRGPLTVLRLGLELRVQELPHTRRRAMELELSRAALALDDLCGVPGGRLGRPLEARWVEDVDVAELMAESVLAWRDVAAGRAVALRLTAPESGVHVAGDRLRLAQAVGNLIANAVEHGGGGVEVSLSAEHGLVRIEVFDRGPGLPAPLHVLCRRGRRRRWSGLADRGYGLAIAAQVADAHGGRLAAAPSVRGARLVLELPAVPQSAADEAADGDGIARLPAGSPVELRAERLVPS